MTMTNSGLRYLALLGMLTAAPFARADATDVTPAPPPVVEPQIDRRDIKIPHINVDDIEIGAYAGLLNMDDFGSAPSFGLRATYHVTEDFFAEAAYGKSTISDAGFRQLGIAIFQKEDQELTQYNFSVGYNLFPGEIYLTRNHSVTSVIYLIGGIGAIDFNKETQTTFNAGLGVSTVPYSWLTLRVDVRDYMFQSDILGTNELKHNIELTLGAAWFF
jgi:outer membrane beta-barrel protein